VDQNDAKFKRKKVQFDEFTLEDERTCLNRPRIIRKFQFPDDLETAVCDVTEHGTTCNEQTDTGISASFRLAI
jgi:hypothetical protein